METKFLALMLPAHALRVHASTQNTEQIAAMRHCVPTANALMQQTHVRALNVTKSLQITAMAILQLLTAKPELASMAYAILVRP
jgi:hypothetical protein